MLQRQYTAAGVAMQPARRAATALARRVGAAQQSVRAAAALMQLHAATSSFSRHGWARAAAAARAAPRTSSPCRISTAPARRTLGTHAGAWPPPPRPEVVATALAAPADADADDAEDAGDEDDSEFDLLGEEPMFPEDHEQYWTDLMETRIVLPSAKDMLPHLDPKDALGVNKARPGVSTSRTSIYSVTRASKARHPRKVVLVRVGEFYEAMGYDAALLVQFCGLNPMGDRPFKAGTPIGNLTRTLDALVRQGFSVVIVEEAPAERLYGQQTALKNRYESGVVTPSSPAYVYGMARGDAGGADTDTFFAGVPPTLGVAVGARGFTLIEVHPNERTYSVLDALPEQALVARLWAAPSAPLYEHASLLSLPGFGHAGTAGTGRGRHTGAALAAALQSRSGARSQYDGAPEAALLQAVRTDLRLPDAVQFRNADPRLVADAPRPLFLSAALALGVVHSAGVPDLLASLLPQNSPRTVADTLRALLLSPPPENVARALRDAHAALRDIQSPLPSPPLVPAGKIARLVDARECSASFLADIAALCSAVQALWTQDALRPLGAALLAPASLATGNALEADRLVADCSGAAAVLLSVLAPGRLTAAKRLGTGSKLTLSTRELLGSAVSDVSSTPEAWADLWPDDDAPPQPTSVPAEMLRKNEDFRGRVRRECVAAAYNKVEAAAAALDAAVQEDLVPFVEAARARKAAGTRARKQPGSGGKATEVAVLYDQVNNAVWLKAGKPAEKGKWAAGVAPELVNALMVPYDRNGRAEKTAMRHTTKRVEAAAEAYRRATDAAEAAVQQVLRNAAERLDPFLASLVAAAEVALYLRLTADHTAEATRRGWCLPELAAEGEPWRVRDLTPPWMQRTGSDTVANSFDCSGMFLLTGPNMAGKSTVARAAGATALLANCGLHVPASEARVPRFRAYFVRMASADAPSEGLSHWGLDMTEAAALADGTALGPGTCVMLDELCQGTEVAHATAMAGALLEALDASGARGIFATHLHGVLRMPLQLRNTTRMAMQTARNPATAALQATMRMEPGECTESLAFEVAEECGLPQALLERANALLPHALPSAESATSPATPARVKASDPPPRRPPLSRKPLSAPTLETAEALLLRECAAVLSDTGEQPQVVRVRLSAGERPPPSTVNRSGIYILRIVRAGVTEYYCGESDGMQPRLETHAQKYRHADALDAAYALVPPDEGAKSRARELEKRTIETLTAAGFPLLNKGDANHKSFGK